MVWYIFGGGFGNVGVVGWFGGDCGYRVGLEGGIRCFKKCLVEYEVRVSVAKVFSIIPTHPV